MLRERFERFVMPAIDGCHYWIGGASRGYGKMMVEGKSKFAHRISFMLHKGSIDESLKICHTCDNTLCVNPDHLFMATQMENVQDMIKKGRHSFSIPTEKHHFYKVTPKILERMLSLRESGYTFSKIARSLNIHPSTAWKHINKYENK